MSKRCVVLVPSQKRTRRIVKINLLRTTDEDETKTKPQCSVSEQGVLGPVPPATETLRADSRAVLCCPEDGRLTFEGWVVVVKER